MNKPITISNEILNACSGCEISLLDLGDRLIRLIEEIQILHFPLLTDHKYENLNNYYREGIPLSDIGILSGGIRNTEHLEIAREMREKCKTLIALGTCATNGGIPALSNSLSNADLLENCFGEEASENNFFNNDFVPKLLDRCYSLDEHIKVDLFIYGCPPHPDNIYNFLKSIIEGKKTIDNTKSVCDTCPTIKKGKKEIKSMRRFLVEPQFNINEPIGKMRCLLEQGFVCMGPVTRGGCGGDEITPLCIKARVPCQGCYGPIQSRGNQRLAMLNAFASNFIDIKEIPNTEYFLAFSGAHNLLKQKLKK